MFVSFYGADNVLKLRKGVKRDAPPSHYFAPSPWRKCYKKDGDNINGKRDDQEGRDDNSGDAETVTAIREFVKDDNSGDAGLDTSAGWELKTAKPDPILAFTRLVCLPIIITTSTVLIDVVVVDVDPGDVDVVVVVVVALFSGGILQLVRKL